MDSLMRGINDILATYQTSIEVEMAKTIKYCAQDAVKQLKATSPSRSGDYAKSWSVKTRRYMYNNVYTIYNKKPGLTHLLENGHDVIKNGKKIGEAPAHSHIAEVEGWLENEIINRLADSL